MARRSLLIAGHVLGAALVAGQAQAQSLIESNVFTRDASGAVVEKSDTNGGAVSVVRQFSDSQGTSWQSSDHKAVTAALQQTMRAAGTLSAFQEVGGTNYSAKTQVDFTKIVTVGAGTSGLALGDVITFNVPVMFDGSSVASAGGLVGRSLSSADISLRYRIRDLDEQVCGEGCRPLEVLKFGYSLRLIEDTAYDESADGGWSGSSLSAYGGPRTELEGDLVDIYNPVPSGSISESMDTGPLMFTIVTRVGHRLEIGGSLDVFLQAYGQGVVSHAAGDYGSTFDAGLVSNVAGIMVQGEVEGVYNLPAVPEPQTWALMLAGLAAVAGGARRQRRAAAA